LVIAYKFIYSDYSDKSEKFKYREICSRCHGD
jgi:hypothetical protein